MASAPAYDPGAVAVRALAAADGDAGDMSAETVWQVLAVVAVAALALSLGCGIVMYVRLQQRQRSRFSLRRAEDFHDGGKAGVAWGADPERGGHCDASLDRSEFKHEPLDASGAVLCETLRELLQEEVGRGLEKGRIADRIERLERRLESLGAGRASRSSEIRERLENLERQVLSGALLNGGCAAAPPLPPFVGADKPQSPMGWSCGSTTSGPPPPTTLPMVPAAYCDMGIMTDPPEESQRARLTHCLSGVFSPSSSSGRSPRVSRRVRGSGALPASPGAASQLRQSLAAAQQALQQKDAETYALTRELRQSQQTLWRQTLDERSLSRRLKDLLCNTGASHAKEIKELQQDITALSSRLADTKAAEWQWSLIVKRQRAYHAQNERAAREGIALFKRHPAGEVFVGPAHRSEDGGEARGRCRRHRGRRPHPSAQAVSEYSEEEMLIHEHDAGDDNTSLFDCDEEEFLSSSSPGGGRSVTPAPPPLPGAPVLDGNDISGGEEPGTSRSRGSRAPPPIDVGTPSPQSPVSAQSL